MLPLLSLASELLPAAFPCHPNWKRGVTRRFNSWDGLTGLLPELWDRAVAGSPVC